MRRKSRKVKSAVRSKAYVKKLKSSIPLNDEDISYDENENQDDESMDDEENLLNENSSSNEEEVLPITDEESESSDENAENEEVSDIEKDLPDVNVWGSKKSIYYNADFVDKDRGKTYRGEDIELEKAEWEAAELQQSGFISFEGNNLEVPLQNSRLTSNKLLKKKSNLPNEDIDSGEVQILMHAPRRFPKLSEYTETFKNKFSEINEKLAPLLELSEKLKLDESFSFYVKLKYQILLHYLTNISFYLYMKSVESVPENHPIFERIEQFKEFDDQMNSHVSFVKAIDDIIEKLKESQEMSSSSENLSNIIPPNLRGKEDIVTEKKKKNILKMGKSQEKEGEDSKKFTLDKVLNGAQTDSDSSEDMIQDLEAENLKESTGEKRTVTYEIAKNKGLIARRKKEHRNPRVHNKMKYRKAKIRRKGQVREVVKEIKRYAGEPTGIAAHVVRSIKLK